MHIVDLHLELAAAKQHVLLFHCDHFVAALAAAFVTVWVAACGGCVLLAPCMVLVQALFMSGICSAGEEGCYHHTSDDAQCNVGDSMHETRICAKSGHHLHNAATHIRRASSSGERGKIVNHQEGAARQYALHEAAAARRAQKSGSNIETTTCPGTAPTA